MCSDAFKTRDTKNYKLRFPYLQSPNNLYKTIIIKCDACHLQRRCASNGTMEDDHTEVSLQKHGLVSPAGPAKKHLDGRGVNITRKAGQRGQIC